MSVSPTGASPIDGPLRVIEDDSPGDPVLQVALEETILRELNEGRGEPTLRLWRCDRAVVLGASRRIKEDVHLDAVMEDGVPLVRRSSGGGTVYHHPDNLCYSFFLPYAWPELRPREKIASSIRLLCGIVVKALQKGGIPAEITNGSDIILAERKVSGTAQQRLQRAMCHHGTVLLNAHVGEMKRYLPIPPGRRTDHSDYLAGIWELGYDPDPETFKSWIREAASETLGVTLREGKLTEREINRVRELVGLKYSRKEWTYRFA